MPQPIPLATPLRIKLHHIIVYTPSLGPFIDDLVPELLSSEGRCRGHSQWQIQWHSDPCFDLAGC
jgi:hypothetical protein